MKRLYAIAAMFTIGLVACTGTSNEPAGIAATEETAAADTAPESSGGMGMGPGGGMMGRSGMMGSHHATIPGEYAGLTNPIPTGDESLARGAEIYTTRCATCHGDGGMGDGPAAAELDPPPVAVAHTSQMMGDDYLYYRISEGGAIDPFNSAMPSWKNVLDEQERWDVINYIRALGSGQVMPGPSMGGMMFDPAAEAVKHEEMANQGVDQGIISQEEADTFLAVHTELDALMAEGMARMGGMEDVRTAILEQLVGAATSPKNRLIPSLGFMTL